MTGINDVSQKHQVRNCASLGPLETQKISLVRQLIDAELVKGMDRITLPAIKGWPAVDGIEPCPLELLHGALPPIRPAIQIDHIGGAIQDVLKGEIGHVLMRRGTRSGIRHAEMQH
jgi:hypothetical protein